MACKRLAGVAERYVSKAPLQRTGTVKHQMEPVSVAWLACQFGRKELGPLGCVGKEQFVSHLLARLHCVYKPIIDLLAPLPELACDSCETVNSTSEW